MADLTIKVSADEYNIAISTLDRNEGKLKEELYKLQEMREKLEGFFISKALSAPLRDMIKKKEKEVQGSIESIQIQIREIKRQMDLMSRAETNIEGKIKDAANTGAKIFQ